MTSQAYNNNDILLFPLQYLKETHRIKCSDHFIVNKLDTDCFEHLHEEQDRDVDAVVLLNSDLQKQQSRGDMKNDIHEE